ncbi:hypothetical protein HOE67_01985 [Candidatus Peregrinibacteria bacterium]|jgi:hypothetical protein|nr:hypothetical protein [Candidatus Peregrinibacteria bacterium]
MEKKKDDKPLLKTKLTPKAHSNRKKFIILIIVAALIAYLAWLIFFSYDSCETWECFNDHLVSCDLATFLGGDDAIFEYTILGTSRNLCTVNVKLLQGELSSQDSRKLENQEMVCNLPKGVIMIPESDIGNCHGLLKEGLQDLVIEKLHTYLVQNVGTINLEILNATDFT